MKCLETGEYDVDPSTAKNLVFKAGSDSGRHDTECASLPITKNLNLTYLTANCAYAASMTRMYTINDNSFGTRLQ